MFLAIKSITLFLFFTLAVQADDLFEKIDIFEEENAQCSTKNGHMILVRSINTSSDIEVQLERYFQNVRQPGRSVVLLHPNDEPHELGCSRVLADSAEQRWKIVKAEIISE